MSHCNEVENCRKPCRCRQTPCHRSCQSREISVEREQGHGFVASTFANTVSLTSGVFQYMGINTLVAGAPANSVDARLINSPQEIRSLRVVLGSALPAGVTLVVSLEVSQDNGASYTSTAALVVTPGFRNNSASFDLLLPARSLHCIGLLTAGGSYAGPVSVTVS